MIYQMPRMGRMGRMERMGYEYQTPKVGGFTGMPIVWMIFIGVLAILPLIYNAFCIHENERTDIPVLFWMFIMGIVVESLEIIFLICLIYVIIRHKDSGNFDHNPQLGLITLIAWITDGVLGSVHHAVFIAFIFIYDPFGYGDFVYPAVIILFELTKITLNMVGMGQIHYWVLQNTHPLPPTMYAMLPQTPQTAHHSQGLQITQAPQIIPMQLPPQPIYLYSP